MKRKYLLILSVLFAAGLLGCARHSVISRTYDFRSVNRIGVLKVRNCQVPVKGVEDIFSQYLIRDGFTVIERSRIKAVLQEHKINTDGALNPSMTQELGKLLGVDVLLIGEVSAYMPEKETTTIVDTEDTYIEPVYTTVRKEVNGQSIDAIEQTGTKVRRERNLTPLTYTTNPRLGVIAKLVDVQTAEVIWVGSVTRSGENTMEAADSAADYLMTNLRKDIESVTKNKKKN